MALRHGRNLCSKGKTVALSPGENDGENDGFAPGKNNAQNVKYLIVKAENIKKIQDTFLQKFLRYHSKKYRHYKVSRYFANTPKPWQDVISYLFLLVK